jgi:hypothetical protein
VVTGTYRWGLLFHTLWIAVFTPILIGLLAAGVFGHRVFLPALVLIFCSAGLIRAELG